jgi:Short C-terminal domain
MIFSSSDIKLNPQAGQPSIIHLPNGEIQIILNHVWQKCPIDGECYFTKVRTKCASLDKVVFFSTLYICADILITMKEMGYDFIDLNQLKKAKNEDKEIILKKYKELLQSNPELYQNNQVQTSGQAIELSKNDELSKLDSFISLHNNLTQSLSKKYRNDTIKLGELAQEIENYFVSKKFGYFGTVTPKVLIETALNGDKIIKAYTGALINTWGNSRETAICVVVSKNVAEIQISCGMAGNYGILSGKSIVGAVFTGGVSLIGNVASNVKDRTHVKSLMDYIDDLMYNFFAQQNISVTSNSSETSIPEKIKQLATLKDQGILTEDEFNQKKTELLARL